MSFFKAYDMRGTFAVDFDLDEVYRIGRALPQVVKGSRWLIARDGRLSSEAMREALLLGLHDAGVEVTDLGLSTTSMLYFFTGEDGFDGSVMITASHNPPTDNGLKVSCTGARPVSYASGLKDVEKIVKDLSARRFEPARVASLPQTSPKEQDAYKARYLAWQEAHGHFADLSSLRLAVDCSNGMSALFARRLFPNALILNDVVDGHFPAHSPNPLNPTAREQVARAVREQGLDAGLIFDGDADRAMFVDETGAFVQCDYLIPVVADETDSSGAYRREHPTILHDIRSSRGAIETLREKGFEPVMVPVGPALAKPLMREREACAGGELAGHYYFREFHFCDSGFLASARVLSALAKSRERGETFSSMMKPIVSRYANSGERNYKTNDKEGAIVRMVAVAESFGAVRARSDMDGVRLEFDEGWLNVRQSNTEPFLRLLVEHRSPMMLQKWIAALETALG